MEEQLSLTVITAKIAQLNDELRHTFIGGKIMMTAGINALPDRTKANILSAVRSFNTFDEDNDPHGKHDFGSFEVDDEKGFWKIDYYDKSMEGELEDPSDPEITTRAHHHARFGILTRNSGTATAHLSTSGAPASSQSSCSCT